MWYLGLPLNEQYVFTPAVCLPENQQIDCLQTFCHLLIEFEWPYLTRYETCCDIYNTRVLNTCGS